MNTDADNHEGYKDLCHYHNNKGSKGNLSLCLNIPSFHYYQTIHDRLQEGSWTSPGAVRWIEAVERHDRIYRVLERYIQHEISRRCCHFPETIHKSNHDQTLRVFPLPISTDFVYDTIHHSLTRNTLPSLSSILQSLDNHDPI